jgi:nucleotide-binding universal stress UspA family protein
MLNVKKILFPTDFSDSAKQALDYALFLAEQFEAELHLLHAVILHGRDRHGPDSDFPEPAEILNRLFEIADSEMTQILEQNQPKTFTLKEAKVRGFSAGTVILEYADENDIDLIIMSTHGRRGPARIFIGSVAEEVVRQAYCPVLTLHKQSEDKTIGKVETILVPVDFSEHSAQAITYAKEIAATTGARLQVLHSIEEPVYPYFYAPAGDFSQAKQLEELRERTDEALDKLIYDTPGPDVPADKYVVNGTPSVEITRFAEQQDSDLIVIPTHGLTGLERMLLGSTAERVVRLATCPVLAVKSYGKQLI